jgi:hypothetical protein
MGASLRRINDFSAAAQLSEQVPGVQNHRGRFVADSPDADIILGVTLAPLHGCHNVQEDESNERLFIWRKWK